MDDYFKWEGVTGGHSRNDVKTQPEIEKHLKKHCVDNKVIPVEVMTAKYNFTTENGAALTIYEVIIKCKKSKAKLQIKQFFKETKFPWVFDVIGDPEQYREC